MNFKNFKLYRWLLGGGWSQKSDKTWVWWPIIGQAIAYQQEIEKFQRFEKYTWVLKLRYKFYNHKQKRAFWKEQGYLPQCWTENEAHLYTPESFVRFERHFFEL
jgi:hypothetical protein